VGAGQSIRTEKLTITIRSYRPNAVAPTGLEKIKSINLFRTLITHPLHKLKFFPLAPPFLRGAGGSLQNPLLTNPLTNRKTPANL